MLFWIKTEDKLPEEGKYVIARYEGGNWKNSKDPEGVNYKIVTLVRGISQEDRNSLPSGHPRKRIIGEEDEYGNNKVPYIWATFGPGNLFGQDVKYWAEFNHIKED